MEAKERHGMVEERHMKALKATKEREEELCHKLAVVKALVEKLRGVAALLATPNTQAFWA
ncbi:hypothetical protein CR513_12137, partial [Mucuna pruriens]